VKSVTASGPYTVVIRLKSRFTPLPWRLGSAGYILSPAQVAKVGDGFGASPVCVGPFKYDNRVPGDRVTVIKSPYYYRQGAVHLDKIVFKVASDAAAAAAALKAGDLQVLDSISTAELQGIEQIPSLRVIPASGLGYVAVWVNVGNGNGVGKLPYSNPGTPLASSPKLRKAFEEAIDRKALGRVVFGGHVQPACTPVSPASPWYDPTIKCTPYDPADARKLVAASGIPSPTVHLMTLNTTDRLRLAQFIQAEEAAVGIDVEIDSADSPTVLGRATAGDYEAWLNS
jgi:peptide/nickel transport system substrate-binding protein